MAKAVELLLLYPMCGQFNALMANKVPPSFDKKGNEERAEEIIFAGMLITAEQRKGLIRVWRSERAPALSW